MAESCVSIVARPELVIVKDCARQRDEQHKHDERADAHGECGDPRTPSFSVHRSDPSVSS
jgi:hypothetical protein